jgi:hypothetical protein
VPFRTKGLECFSMTMHIRIQLLALEYCWIISTGSCLTILLTALILLQATTTCLPTWRTCCIHSSSEIMRSRWKVSKRGSAHRWQDYFDTGIQILIPRYDKCSIPVVTTLRSSWSMYVFLYYIIFFSLLILLTAHWSVLSE